MTELIKVTDSRRPDLEFMLIEAGDFDSKFQAHFNETLATEVKQSGRKKQEEVSNG